MIGRGQTANKGIGPVRKEKYTQDDIDAAVAAEREACAQIAEDRICGCGDHQTEVAEMIRARGKQP